LTHTSSCILIPVISRFDYADFAFAKVFAHNSQIGRFLTSYDINCSYSKNFQSRVDENPYLQALIPAETEVTPSVGKFHLGAHVIECFHQYSLNFVDGAGQIDGEVSEHLWSVLNKFSNMCRHMSLPGRQEVLDQAMDDSNFKKLIAMRPFIYAYPSILTKHLTFFFVPSARTLVTKVRAAVAGLKETDDFFREWDADMCKADQEVEKWKVDYVNASKLRGNYLSAFKFDEPEGFPSS
jgi:hypothetical protein